MGAPERDNGEGLEPGQVVSREIAESEFNAWLDYKRIKEPLRSLLFNAWGNGIINLICEGTFSIDPKTFQIIHTLTFPLGEGGKFAINELKYSPRMNIAGYSKNLAFAPTDSSGKIISECETTAVIATLAGITYAEAALLDSEDFRRARLVAFFFQT